MISTISNSLTTDYFFRAKDESGLTPLHIASQQGRLEIVKWLTAMGINLNTETQTGYTAIHLAAMNGHLNCMIVSWSDKLVVFNLIFPVKLTFYNQNPFAFTRKIKRHF